MAKELRATVNIFIPLREGETEEQATARLKTLLSRRLGDEDNAGGNFRIARAVVTNPDEDNSYCPFCSRLRYVVEKGREYDEDAKKNGRDLSGVETKYLAAFIDKTFHDGYPTGSMTHAFDEAKICPLCGNDLHDILEL